MAAPSGNHEGGPLLIESVEDLAIRLNQVFDDCDRNEDARALDHDGTELKEFNNIDK